MMTKSRWMSRTVRDRERNGCVMTGCLRLAGQNELDESRMFALSCPFKSIHRGKALRLVLGNVQTASPESANAILRALARARSWYDQIVAGEVNGIPDLARRHGVTPRYVKKILPCAWLGPESVETILNGRCSPQLTLESTLDRLPVRWEKQQEIVERNRLSS